MATYAELSADLLKDAAAFFRTLADENESVRQDMTNNAAIYERVGELLLESPRGVAASGHTYAQLAGKLLHDTATFYRKLADQNGPIKEQMEHNAAIYDQIAGAVTANPLGILEEG